MVARAVDGGPPMNRDLRPPTSAAEAAEQPLGAEAIAAALPRSGTAARTEAIQATMIASEV
jgi:hypothetical protein